MKQTKCSTKHCRGEVEIVYLDKPLCWKCWAKQCNEDDKNGIPEVLCR